MDEFDSSYPFYFSESSFNFGIILSEIELPEEKNEENPIEPNQNVNQQQDDDSEKSRKRDRVDNNIFKTPLSEFRKVMKHFLAKKKIRSNVFHQINKEKRNYSTFPKYWILCAKMGFKDVLRQLFRVKMDGILAKKKKRVSQKRYLELDKVYSKMLRSLECMKIEEAVKEYWGRYRQKSKFAESWEEIRKFENFLETIN